MYNNGLKKRGRSWKQTFLLLPLLIILPVLSISIAAEKSQTPSQKSVQAALPEEARTFERILGLHGLSNVGRVAPSVYRGAQPQPEGYNTLKKIGIKTVINLRAQLSEKKAVESAGMRSVEVPMRTYTTINDENVRKVVSIMADPANQPVFIHCKHGKDRTGVVVAIYRMEADGWSLADAEEEMKAFGFDDRWYKLKEFVRSYPVNKRKGFLNPSAKDNLNVYR